MKLHFRAWSAILVLVFATVSCKEKAKDPAAAPAEDDKAAVEKVVDKVKDTVVPEVKSSISVEERAAKLGFAKYLPADTEMMLSVYNAEQAAEQLKALEMYGIIERSMWMGEMDPEMQFEDDGFEDDGFEEELLEEEQGEEDDLAGQAPDEMGEGPGPWTLLGQEVTIALGNTSGDQLANLVTVQSRIGFFQARALGRAAQKLAKDGRMEDFSDELASSMEGSGLIRDLMQDSEFGTKLLDEVAFPPIYIAFRAKDGEIEQAAQLVNSSMAFFGMAGEMAAPIEIETGGFSFAGFKLLGAKIAETMEAGREDIEEDLGAETTDAMMAAIGKKNLIIVSGTVGDYVVMMIGGDENSIKLVSDTGESLVSTNELNFTDAYADKQLVSVAYGDGEVLGTLMDSAGGIASYALGMREGIMGGQNLGDTRDIEEMLQIIADREKALLALGSSADTGMVAFVDEGLKIESFGGYDKGGIDWDAETELSHLGDSGDNLLFLNIPSNALHDEKMGGYLEAIFETAYAMTMRVASLDIDDSDFAEMKGYTQLFNEKFREDTLGIYEAISGDFADGIGHESAFIIDLKGSVPAIPGFPQEVVDGGKAPRLAVIFPVTDRSKLVASWNEINVRATSLLATISEMSGEKIPMQKPISSEKDGMTTWFISFPFFQDDFMPSVTLSDDWFAASTSKTQALDLMGKAAAGGEKGNGVKFYMNFNALSSYADEMLAMADKNSKVLFTSERKMEKFNGSKAMIREVIDASREFESMTWDVRREEGHIRSTIHFKTK